MLSLFHKSIVPPVNAAQPGTELNLPQWCPPRCDPSDDPVGGLGSLGDAGASTLRLNGDAAVLVLPAASVAVAVKLCVPVDSLAVVRFQAPLAFALAVPIDVVPSNNLTVLPASAVPDKVRTLAVVILSPTVPVSGVKAVILGADGATVSGVVTTGGVVVADPCSGGGRSA